MYTSIIPLSHSLSNRPYTYSVSEIWKPSVTIGGIVEIPIGKEIVLGCIASILTDIPETPYEIKPILSVVSKSAILSVEQLRVIESISLMYCLPIHKVANLFLPAPLIRVLEKSSWVLQDNQPIPEQKREHTFHHFLDHIFNRQDFEQYDSDRSAWIFPDDLFLLAFFDTLPIDESILLAEATPQKRTRFWKEMREGKLSRIIGTRRLLYYNLSHFSHIYYVEESFYTEQFQFPTRIRYTDILRAMADFSHLSIHILSSSPSLSTFANFRDFTYTPRKD